MPCVCDSKGGLGEKRSDSPTGAINTAKSVYVHHNASGRVAKVFANNGASKPPTPNAKWIKPRNGLTRTPCTSAINVLPPTLIVEVVMPLNMNNNINAHNQPR